MFVSPKSRPDPIIILPWSGAPSNLPKRLTPPFFVAELGDDMTSVRGGEVFFCFSLEKRA